MAVEIRLARPEDGVALAANLRPEDLAEVQAYGWVHDIEASMVDNIRRSLLCWTAEEGGDLVAVFGVAPLSMTGGIGSPWMLGTPLLERRSRVLVAQTRVYIPRMLRAFPFLFNHVHARNTRSVRWLARLGFTVQPAQPYGTAGELFHPFFMKA